MKKVFAVLLAMILAISTAACGTTANNDTETVSPTTETASPTDEFSDIEPTEDISGMNIIRIVPVTADLGAVTADELSAIREFAKYRLGDDAAAVIDEENKQVLVGMADEIPDGTAEELTAKPVLTFRDPDGEIVMDGSEVLSAAPYFSETYYLVLIKFTESGKDKFTKITEEYMNQTISVYLDDELITSPTINAPITDGEAQIFGDFTAEEVTDLSTKISFAVLPFELKAVIE